MTAVTYFVIYSGGILLSIVPGDFGCHMPRAGSGVVRIDPLRFLAGCRTRRLNQV